MHSSLPFIKPWILYLHSFSGNAYVILWQLRGRTTVISDTPDGKKQIKTLSTARVLWFIGVQLVRVGVALTLLYGGQYFLANEVNLTELLLNTVCAHARVGTGSPNFSMPQVALEFILMLDEKCLDAFAPRRLICMVDEVEDLWMASVAPVQKMRGLGMHVLAKLPASVVTLGIVTLMFAAITI